MRARLSCLLLIAQVDLNLRSSKLRFFPKLGPSKQSLVFCLLPETVGSLLRSFSVNEERLNQMIKFNGGRDLVAALCSRWLDAIKHVDTGA